MTTTQGSQRLGAADDTPSVAAVRIDEGLQVTPGVAPTGTPKTAMQRRAEAAVASGDEDRIVAQIEATRAELAETIEELADRLNPRNVADRTKAQLTEKAQEKVAVAKGALASAATTAKNAAIVARDKAAVAADQAKERAALAAETAKEKVTDVAETAMDKAHIPHGSDDSDGSLVDLDSGSVRSTSSSTAMVPVPGTKASSSTPPLTLPGIVSYLRVMGKEHPEYAVGGSVAVVLSLLWVVDRFRK